jgi:hypothetical protein
MEKHIEKHSQTDSNREVERSLLVRLLARSSGAYYGHFSTCRRLGSRRLKRHSHHVLQEKSRMLNVLGGGVVEVPRTEWIVNKSG